MIIIEKPKVVTDGNLSILETYISIDDKRKRLWFKVDKKYEVYLCFERSDAYVIAALDFAMRNHHDIRCEAPITEELFYNLDKYFIDALTQNNKDFYRTQIFAECSNDELPCAGAVGTGISCGVDSLHSLVSQTKLKYSKHNITHLTFNNVGSHGEGENAEKLYQQRVKRPQQFAEEYGFKFVASDSNLADVIKQNHFKTHTYSSMFPVFCLQKLYSVYYYASGGYKYNEYTLVDSPISSSGSYENFSLPLFSTKGMRIYSEGEGMSRMMKLRSVVRYEPSYKYLNVCLSTSDNCSRCEKCVRTMLELDALGALENYRSVFDVDYYKAHKQWYLKQMLLQMARKKRDYFEIYPYFKNQISIRTRIISIVPMMRTKIYHKIPEGELKKILRKVYGRKS